MTPSEIHAQVDAAALVTLFIGVYILPAVIAIWRRHPSWMAIAAVDLLLGWSIAGWFVALIWSLTGTRKPA